MICRKKLYDDLSGRNKRIGNVWFVLTLGLDDRAK